MERHSCKLEAGLGLYEARDLVQFSEDVDESWMASTICTHGCTVNEGGKEGLSTSISGPPPASSSESESDAGPNQEGCFAHAHTSANLLIDLLGPS